MNNQSSTSSAPVLSWIEPLHALQWFEGEPCVLLHSTLQNSYSGRMSLLAGGLEEVVEGDDFDALEVKLSSDRGPFENCWFGYIGYAMRHRLEKLPKDAAGPLPSMAMWFGRFREIYLFDHDAGKMFYCGESPAPNRPAPQPIQSQLAEVSDIYSNMSRDIYLKGVYRVLEDIHKGNLYQANLTRKFYGTLAKPASPISLFAALCAKSPSAYGAYINTGDLHILSSSPERFLQSDAVGNVNTRPIKGSAPRSEDGAADAKLRQGLIDSTKDRAENLMIVDLMRNDLSRACIPGSVEVESLYDIDSYSTIHHLSSSISARRRAGLSALGLVKECFPPGSMTGAPKISAMKLCSELEGAERGIYSGALGYFGGDGAFDLSVVIRTLLLRDDFFEFQVGGGIVADSSPEAELEETITKARAISHILGLSHETLHNI